MRTCSQNCRSPRSHPAFQVSDANPLLGLEGRTDLLQRLGKLVAERPDVFGSHDTPRPGGLFDHIAAQATNGTIPAPAILSAVLNQLGPIWPSRLELAGVPTRRLLAPSGNQG